MCIQFEKYIYKRIQKIYTKEYIIKRKFSQLKQHNQNLEVEDRVGEGERPVEGEVFGDVLGPPLARVPLPYLNFKLTCLYYHQAWESTNKMEWNKGIGMECQVVCIIVSELVVLISIVYFI